MKSEAAILTENKTIYLIIDELKTKKGILLLILLFNLLTAFTSIIQPVAFQQLFDDVLPNENYREAVLWISAIVCIPLLFTLFTSAKIYLSNELGSALAASIRKRLFQHILEVKSIDLNKIGSGEVINRLTQQIGILCDVFIVDTLLRMITNSTILIVTFSVLFSMSIPLTMITFFSLPLFSFSLRKMRGKTHQLMNQQMTVIDKGLNFLQGQLSNIKSVHIFNGQAKERQFWNQWNKENWETSRKTKVFHGIYVNVISDIIVSLVTGIVYAYSLYLLINGDLSLGTLLAFIVALPRLYTLFKEVFLSNIEIFKMKTIVGNLNELFDLETIFSGRKNLEQDKLFELKIDHVSFQYDNESEAGLKDFSLNVQKGEFIGIVGLSGSGKSTLFDLIHRHIEPQNGKIFLNNISIDQYKLADLRNYIGYNPQKLQLWNATLLENIIYPLDLSQLNQEAEERLKRAIHLSQLKEFISRLPKKMETIINQSSDNLSGGEIQRIILARVLFLEPNILMLDEYASALDAITENHLNNTLKKLKGKQSLIVIAHRLSTLKYADRIAVVDKGKLIEFGSFEELIEKEGTFYQMYTAQKI